MGTLQTNAHARVVRVLLLLTLVSLPAHAAPPIVEESARIAPPEPHLPLNGPVRMEGNTIVVGSRVLEHDADFRLAVYVFEREAFDAPWKLTRKLVELTTFGEWSSQLSLGLSGNTAAVATYNTVYVYERTSGGWNLSTTLTKPAWASDFGSDVAISLDRLLVGGIANGLRTGFVYERNATGQWVFSATLNAGLAYADEGDIGPDVDLVADRAIVGTSFDGPPPPNFESGRLYFFRALEDGSWLAVDNQTGWKPSQSGAREVAMALPYAAMNEDIFGVSYFEEMEPDEWVANGHFKPIDAFMLGQAPAREQLVLDMDYNVQPAIAVGTPGDEDRGTNSGSVTVYEGWVSTSFVPRAKLLASDSSPDLTLGRDVSIHSGRVAATSRDALYVFDLPTWTSFYEPPPLQDTFEDGNSAGWIVRSSTWNVVSASNTRVYRQTRSSGDALTLLDDVDWTNQAIQVDVQPLAFNGADRWVGLVARYADDHNNYYVTLRSSNRLELGKRVANKFTTLGSVPLSVAANRPYRLRLEAIGTWLRVYVDGVLKIEARDAALTHGTAGLRTSYAQAQYDNVVVSRTAALTLLADDFEDESWDSWTKNPAENWSNVSSGGNRILRQSVAAGPARAISGVGWDHIQNTRDADQIVEARARALSFITGQDPWFGLIARYSDDANYVYITVNRNGYISLRKLVNGAIEVFDTAPFTLNIGTWYQFRLEAIGENLRVYVNRRLVLEGTDSNSNSNGLNRYGLMTSRAAVDFDEVKVTQP